MDNLILSADKAQFLNALEKFRDAGHHLMTVWEGTVPDDAGGTKYPFKDSFPEVAANIQAWYEAVTKEFGGGEASYVLEVGDGEKPLGDLEDFIKVNESDEDEASDLRDLKPGETYRGGGGAAGTWYVRRES